VFSPLLRLINSIRRAVSRLFKRYLAPKPFGHAYELGVWENSACVQTKYGSVSGFLDKDTWCWKGIPYATPPVGQLRWRAPLDPIPWLGMRKTRRFGSAAAQVMMILGPMGSEDCLYLNIWRPKTPETDLPVYLYIHGGGNSIGSAASPSYYGNAVAAKSNLLYVSVNYRLGAMGWFVHPAVTSTGSAEDRSGNYGTLDLVKSLEWVRDNIRAFGGDPSNVTIAGESGGAFNVLSLLASPSARGFFHRAVVESGLALTWSTEEATAQSDELLKALLIKDRKFRNEEEVNACIGKMSNDEINEYLRSKSAFTIMKSIPTMDFGMARWRAIFRDGTVIPNEGYNVFSTEAWANKVPVIIGCTKDEIKLFGYFRGSPPMNTREYDLVWKYHSLLWRANGVDDPAGKMAAHDDVSVYAYRFDWGSPDKDGVSVLPNGKGQKLGAHHGAEIPFFLGTGQSDFATLVGKTHTKHNQRGSEKLVDLCMRYLADFARTGNPNSSDVPNWPAWDSVEGKEKILVLDAGFDDLRLSYLNEAISYQTVIDLVNSEVEESEQRKVLAMLEDFIRFR
jgi:para-nitrobenzyl esterase